MIITCMLQGTLCNTGIPCTCFGGNICSVGNRRSHHEQEYLFGKIMMMIELLNLGILVILGRYCSSIITVLLHTTSKDSIDQFEETSKPELFEPSIYKQPSLSLQRSDSKIIDDQQCTSGAIAEKIHKKLSVTSCTNRHIAWPKILSPRQVLKDIHRGFHLPKRFHFNLHIKFTSSFICNYCKVASRSTSQLVTCPGL